MPTFIKYKNKYIVNYITGPQHVSLGLGITSGNPCNFNLTKKPAIGICNHGVLNETKIRESIIDGLNKANKEFNTHYRVNSADYFENDSPNYALYSHCTYLIFKAIVNDIDFKETDKW